MKRKFSKRRSRNTKVMRRKRVREKDELKNRRRMTARISAVLTVLALTYLLVHSLVWFFKSQEYPVKDIRFEGALHLDSEELCKRAGISRNSSLLAIDLKEISERLLGEACIKEAVVSRNFSTGEVSIKLNLRKPVALINCDGLYGIDRDGVVIGRIDKLSESDLPLISGEDFSGIRPGEKLEKKSLRLALEILDYVSTTNLEAFAMLSEINVSNMKNIVLYVGREATQIRLGKADFNKKVDNASTILADYHNRGEKVRYIDFRFAGKIFVK